MLADQGLSPAFSGGLDRHIHRPDEWISSLILFMADVLPGWRDDPKRQTKTAEDALSSQLCARLASVCRHTSGWDILQFRREEPDDLASSRTIDMAAAPAGAIIWIKGRSYNEYQTLIPIECKRLPTPTGKDRDPREYLVSDKSSTGGVQRFKAGHHGGGHNRATMIAYVQEHDAPYWQKVVDTWIDNLVGEGVPGWSVDEKFRLLSHDAAKRVARLASTHARAGKTLIEIDHLWVEM